MTAKEIAEEAYKHRNDDPNIHCVDSLEHRINEHTLSVIEKAVRDEKKANMTALADSIGSNILKRVKNR